MVYFYCDYKDSEKQTVHGFLSSTIVQLCQQEPAFFTTVGKFYESNKDTHRTLRTDELLAILKDNISKLSKTIIIIDALDECAEVEDLITILLEIKAVTSSHVRLLLSSRREANIRKLLAEAEYQIELQGQNVQADIETYVSSHLQQNLSSGKLKLRNPSLEAEIREALIKGSQGM